MSDYYFLLWSSYEIYIKNILGFDFPAKKIECYAKEVIDIGNKYIEYTFEKENIEKSILDSYRNEDMARLREILYELNKFFIDFDVFKGPIRRRIALIKLRKKEKRDKN